MFGTLFVVSTPIGNLEDITLRALRVLREADLVAAEDTRHTAILLTRYDIRTPTTSFHEHNERQKLPQLIDQLRAGTRIALVSDAGTPGIRDPGYRLVRAAVEAGIRVEAVPGASAVLTVLVASGLPTDAFAFLGFAPTKSSARLEWLVRAAAEPRTVIFFEAPHRIRQTLEALSEVAGEREVVIGRELTKLHEEILRGTPATILGQLTEPRGEITVVLGPAPATPTAAPPTDEAIWDAYQRLVTESQTDRRGAVSTLARRHGLPSKAIYAAIERQKSRTAQD
ncbi:MAG: 16S rRNA (cytidine(1402)-2'-O)-methyltransferase [Bacteroidales bacterium]